MLPNLCSKWVASKEEEEAFGESLALLLDAGNEPIKPFEKTLSFQR
jgi:hypothetical protein